MSLLDQLNDVLQSEEITLLSMVQQQCDRRAANARNDALTRFWKQQSQRIADRIAELATAIHGNESGV